VDDTTTAPQSTRRSTLWPSLALLGLILLAFALRVYRLPAQSLWYDEGVSWYLTRMSLPALTTWTADDIQPPLYYYLLWSWARLAGTSEYALRFLSVGFGALSLPLMWATARWLLGRRAAWLAVLLLTLSPLHVYYAQEARMYTFLTFLGLLSSYLLLRLLNARPTGTNRPEYATPYSTIETQSSSNLSQRPRRLRGELSGDQIAPGFAWPLIAPKSLWTALAYVLAIVAALYTHYFGFFLLAAHALFAMYKGWQQIRSGQPLRLSVPISIAIAITILYLPWLPFLLTRYGVDTSYWPGALKPGEVARKLFIAFSLGETVTEGIGTWLALGYGIILLISVMILWRSTRYAVRTTQYKSRTAYRVLRKDILFFLLSYLFVPVILVLLLVQRTPKFNPRYAMLASPAFILLIAGGLSCLAAPAASRNTDYVSRLTFHVSRFTFHVSRFTFHIPRFIFVAALFFILTTSFYSLHNWFQPYPTNQFNKADFRITAQIVGERIGADETVLLSSGHMFPAWAYYYGWAGWHRLPDSEILDVNAALDLSVGDELDRLLRGKRGTWLVRWQNEVTDPFDVLPLYLGTVGTQDDYGQFWHMELFHYNLPPEARFDLDSFIAQRAQTDFDGQVRLLGMRQVSSQELVLFWQGLVDIKVDYTIFVHLLDAGGETLVNADHLPPRPMHEWRPSQIIPDRVMLAIPPDLPAGDYQIEIGLYDASDPALPRLSLGDGSGDRAILLFHVEADDLE
jgi:4-amino-4-deoxy-L-arabinose transferase-like glycosyltransferase